MPRETVNYFLSFARVYRNTARHLHIDIVTIGNYNGRAPCLLKYSDKMWYLSKKRYWGKKNAHIIVNSLNILIIIYVLSLHFTQKRENKSNYNTNIMDETKPKLIFSCIVFLLMIIRCFSRELDSNCSTEVVGLWPALDEFVEITRVLICNNSIGLQWYTIKRKQPW